MIVAQVLKAIVAFIGSIGAGMVTAAVDDGISSGEWYGIVGSALVVGAAVWTVPNKIPPGGDNDG